MPNKFVFADEAGNLDFSSRLGAGRYFVLTTLVATDCRIGEALMQLRRDLVWEGHPVNDGFHASEDAQAVRDRVFELLSNHAFRIDATIFEKSKAMSHLAQDETLFYKTAWYYHFRHVAPKAIQAGDEVQIVSASLGTKKKRSNFRLAVEEVATQVLPRGVKSRVGYWSASSDPCLQAADYCCWAIQRKWERNDTRSHSIIADKIESEFDIWANGTVQPLGNAKTAD